MGISLRNDYSVLALDAINTFFMHPDIPIGTTKSEDAYEPFRTADDVSGLGDTPEEAETNKAEEKIAAVEDRRFDADNPPAEPEPVATLKGVTVATVENFVVLSSTLLPSSH